MSDGGAGGTASATTTLSTQGRPNGVIASAIAPGGHGGAHGSSGSGTETFNSVAQLTVNLTKLRQRDDLLLGLYQDTARNASAIGSIDFDVYADGYHVIDQSFTSAAAVTAYFNDHALDLGSLASGMLSGDTLAIRASPSVTTTAAGACFYGDLVLGDAPSFASASASGIQRLAHAMAAFGGGGGAGSMMPASRASADRSAMTLAASPYHHA